ncbi:trehalase family glycosidase [Streptomyces glaucosporus]|uniref:Trehalase family glycosidase n=1 Tax=Streptomyces glaucosporus TaxID=284044 RepID=A0ABN3HW24_9ACTN
MREIPPVRLHVPAQRSASGSAADGLRDAARRVLLRNWTGGSTVPSRSLYPHQWSWDSAFVAIGLRHLSPERAQRELETLLAAQWGDGRVPHIVFNPAVPLDAYFPSPDFWRSSTAGAAAGAPADVETSGIVQPPVHALAAWLVHRADPALSRRRGFLRRLYPKLVAWHHYLTAHRDLGRRGLVSVVHPWEPGMDNSPCWDGPLARVEPAPPGSFRRADLDHGSAADRPTDLDYARYVRLAADYRDHGYLDARAPHRFAVEDPGVNALLIASEHALADIAEEIAPEIAPVSGAREELRADADAHRRRARELTAALVDGLWDAEAGQFLCFDVRSGRPIAERSVAGLLPLIVPGLPRDVVGALLDTVRGEHFGLGGAVRLVPSYDLRGHAFDPRRYWRGPAWFNINWLMERGLRQHGRTADADALRAAVLAAAASSDFAEYVDPHTGAGHGSREFSWTAALVLDLLHRTARAGEHAPVPAAVARPRARVRAEARAEARAEGQAEARAEAPVGSGEAAR